MSFEEVSDLRVHTLTIEIEHPDAEPILLKLWQDFIGELDTHPPELFDDYFRKEAVLMFNRVSTLLTEYFCRKRWTLGYPFPSLFKNFGKYIKWKHSDLILQGIGASLEARFRGMTIVVTPETKDMTAVEIRHAQQWPLVDNPDPDNDPLKWQWWPDDTQSIFLNCEREFLKRERVRCVRLLEIDKKPLKLWKMDRFLWQQGFGPTIEPEDSEIMIGYSKANAAYLAHNQHFKHFIEELTPCEE